MTPTTTLVSIEFRADIDQFLGDNDGNLSDDDLDTIRDLWDRTVCDALAAWAGRVRPGAEVVSRVTWGPFLSQSGWAEVSPAGDDLTDEDATAALNDILEDEPFWLRFLDRRLEVVP